MPLERVGDTRGKGTVFLVRVREKAIEACSYALRALCRAPYNGRDMAERECVGARWRQVDESERAGRREERAAGRAHAMCV